MERLLLGAMILLAFGLRVHRLAGQSIWYDEGLSIYYARQPLSELLALVSGSDHPPLYFLLLHVWLRVAAFGQPATEFVVRYPSAIFGVLLIPLVYAMGRRLPRPQAGLIAAGLLTISPFHVGYSQETRMYTLVVLLTLLASYSLWSNLQPPSPDPSAALRTGLQSPISNPRASASNSSWAIYIFTTALALYAHFYVGLVLLAHATYMTAWAWRRHMWDVWSRWTAAACVAVLLFLPWGGLAAGQLQTNDTYWRGTLALGQTISRTVQAFAVGETVTGLGASLPALAYLLLVGLGVFIPLRRRAARITAAADAAGFLLACVLIPTMALLAISYGRPKFAPRYLLLVTPALALLASQGVAALWPSTAVTRGPLIRRALALVLLTTIIATSGLSLWRHFTDERQFKSDWRAAARYVNRHAMPRDAVVIVAGHAMPAFDFYNTRDLSVYPIPPRLLPTVSDPVESAEVTAILNQVKQDGHDRIWLILWQELLADPRRLTLSQLFEQGRRQGINEGFHGLAMLLFELPPDAVFRPLRPRRSLNANFGQRLRLEGFDLWPDSITPGGTLTLRLYWRAIAPVTENYTAFTQLLSPEDRIVGQHDRRLGGDLYPTSHWPVGEPVRETYELKLAPDTPPGQYRLIAGIYLPETGTRLPVTGNNAAGDHVVVKEIEIR